MPSSAKLPHRSEYGVNHKAMDAVVKILVTNTARAKIAGATLLSRVDNSTGSGTVTVAVNTVNKFVHAGGTTLAAKAGVDTALGKTNNAVAVLKGIVNELSTTLGIDCAITGGNGTVATPGTIPAQDKTVAGVDGSSANALERDSFNTQLVQQRNNLAVIIKALNYIAINVGHTTLANNTGGVAGPGNSFALVNPTATAAGVLAAGNVAAKADVDTALTALANTIAGIKAYIDGLDTACDTQRYVEIDPTV